MARGRMLNKSISASIYLIEDTETGALKIGISSDVNRRLAQLESRTGHKLFLKATVESFNAQDDEWMLHSHFRERRIEGEWFDLDESEVEEVYDYFDLIAMQTRVRKAHIEKIRKRQDVEPALV